MRWRERIDFKAELPEKNLFCRHLYDLSADDRQVCGYDQDFLDLAQRYFKFNLSKIKFVIFACPLPLIFLTHWGVPPSIQSCNKLTTHPPLPLFCSLATSDHPPTKSCQFTPYIYLICPFTSFLLLALP